GMEERESAVTLRSTGALVPRGDAHVLKQLRRLDDLNTRVDALRVLRHAAEDVRNRQVLAELLSPPIDLIGVEVVAGRRLLAQPRNEPRQLRAHSITSTHLKRMWLFGTVAPRASLS